MILERVISGGQVGADIAGLRAAHIAGIPTGGTCPKGWRTMHGNSRASLQALGLVEHDSPDYPPRTRANVRDSDGTVRFATSFDTRGEVCTLNAIRKLKKPVFDVSLRYFNGFPPGYRSIVTPKSLADWIVDHDINVLNVAGNANPQIEEIVIRFLTVTFAILREET